MTNRTLCVFTALSANLTFAGMTSSPAFAQNTALDRLSIHGFLTQAYGITDGHQFLGLPSYGTADYRTAALLFRYDATDRDVFAVQFSHERLGLSPLGALEPAVDLDWIFYEHRFGDRTIARVGKIRTPIGIYNEFRDVGTLLPLYRPPVGMYGEQLNRSETVDGAMIGHEVPLGDWSLNLEAFFGSWEYTQADFQTRARVDRAYGTQLWVNTPVEGLRAGGGAMHMDVRNVMGAPPGLRDNQLAWYGALDGMFSRFFVRSEYFRISFGEEEAPFTGAVPIYFVEAGFNLTERLSLVGQAEFIDITLEANESIPQPVNENIGRDFALGIRYQPSPFLAFKLEGHRHRGYGIEDSPEVEVPVPGLGELDSVTYGLFSISTSF